jgi:hypothetical protein
MFPKVLYGLGFGHDAKYLNYLGDLPQSQTWLLEKSRQKQR